MCSIKPPIRVHCPVCNYVITYAERFNNSPLYSDSGRMVDVSFCNACSLFVTTDFKIEQSEEGFFYYDVEKQECTEHSPLFSELKELVARHSLKK